MTAFDRPSRRRGEPGDVPAVPPALPVDVPGLSVRGARTLSTAGAVSDWEIGPLVRLCKAVVQAGFIQVEFRDALPRLILHGAGGVWVDVRVADNHTEFVWGRSGVRHPVGDVAGAARALIAFVHDLDGPARGGAQ